MVNDSSAIEKNDNFILSIKEHVMSSLIDTGNESGSKVLLKQSWTLSNDNYSPNFPLPCYQGEHLKLKHNKTDKYDLNFHKFKPNQFSWGLFFILCLQTIKSKKKGEEVRDTNLLYFLLKTKTLSRKPLKAYFLLRKQA